MKVTLLPQDDEYTDLVRKFNLLLLNNNTECIYGKLRGKMKFFVQKCMKNIKNI